MSESRLELRDVTRTFEQAGERLDVLRGINFSIRPGELVALVGPSGSGKSTLLHVAGLLEAPTTGAVLVNGEVAGDLDDASRTALRRRTIGFVYQAHHLLPEFSALENVVIPQMLNGRSRRDASERAQGLLERVALGHRVAHRPARLSGGEQQRVAIVRALANQPALLLADEPTGNLDPHTAEDVFAMLTDLVRSTGVGALIATHNFELAGRMDRVLRLQDGRVESA